MSFDLGYELPWEDKSFIYPSNMAPGLDVAIEASNGASDYGNKFGEPVLTGFARSFGMMVSEEERREWVKPIMFSGGIGSLEASHVNKETPGTGEIPPEGGHLSGRGRRGPHFHERSKTHHKEISHNRKCHAN